MARARATLHVRREGDRYVLGLIGWLRATDIELAEREDAIRLGCKLIAGGKFNLVNTMDIKR